MIIKYYTVNGVTDLVLNNVTSFGDGSPYGTWNFESMYTDGLDLAENTSYGVAGHNVFIAGMKEMLLANSRTYTSMLAGPSRHC